MADEPTKSTPTTSVTGQADTGQPAGDAKATPDTGKAAAAPETGGDTKSGAETNNSAQDHGNAKGDLTVALRKERQENRALRQQIAKLTAGKINHDESKGTQTSDDFADIQITEDMAMDLAAGNVEEFNKTLQKGLSKAYEVGRKAALTEAGSMQAAGDVESIINEYEIFTDESNPKVARHALLVLNGMLDGLPETATEDQVRELVETVAADFSNYAVKTHADPEPEKARQTAGPQIGDGDATTAHMRAERKALGSIGDALKQVSASARQKLSMRK